jgi:hypothetical protein
MTQRTLTVVLVAAMAASGIVSRVSPASGAAEKVVPPRGGPRVKIESDRSVTTAKPLKCEGLTKEQFMALADSVLLECQGRRLTKHQLLEEVKRQALIEKKTILANAPGNRAALEGIRTKKRAEQDRLVRENNDKIAARLVQLSQVSARRNALRLEDKQLHDRWLQAGPDEKAQIQKRAAELAGQFKQLGL